MKLFTLKEATFETTRKKADMIVEISYLENTLNNLQKMVNAENQSFEKQLKIQQNLYSEEKIKLQEELKDLMNKVDVLEARREKALIPVNVLKRENEELSIHLTKQIALVERKEEVLNEKIKLLQDKIDDISDRECIIEDTEKKLSQRVKSAHEEASMVSKGHQELNNKIANFYEETRNKTLELIEKENLLNARENMLKQNFAEHKKKFDEDNKLLLDKRQALERFAQDIKKI